MATYNQWSTSPIRTKFMYKDASDTVIGKLSDENLLRNIAKTVNRTWVYSASGNTVDANQCEHVVDKLFLLGCGHLNCTGRYNGNRYLADADYDTSCFSGKFTPQVNYWDSANASRVKYMVNADGSTGGSAFSWWLRSAYSDDDNRVGSVYYDGWVSYYYANYNYGCSPAFQIG